MAETYDRVRPTYPTELFEAVFSYGRLAAGDALVCESGAGTGKATVVAAPRLVASRWPLTCVEPDEQMAAVLRRNLSDIEGLEASVVVSGFEEFAESVTLDHRRQLFSLLYAAQSWHWVSPERRSEDAARVLRDGGTLALIWNVAGPHPPPLQHALDAVYRRVLGGRPWRFSAFRRHAMPAATPEPPGAGLGSAPSQYEKELLGSGLFTDVTVERVPWTARHDTGGWLTVLETHSDHRLLPTETLSRLLAEVARVIDEHGGVVEVQYAATAIMARRLRRTLSGEQP